MERVALKVPLLDLQPQYAAIRADVLAAIERVCDSQHFIMGQEVERFEAEIAEMIGVAHAVGVSSGTDALLVALMSLGIGPGDEVITPTFSFFATAGSVARLGATPVFVDVRPDTLMMDAEAVAAALTTRTKAIVPVHLFGLSADMDPIVALASSRGVPVVEDAAQALGATYRGRQAGTIGTLGCFSFFPSKHLGAFGDAGLVTTNDAGLAARVRRLRNHGMEPKYYHHEIGGNFRLDALQAAVLRVKLPHMPAWNAQRRANAARYGELFSQMRQVNVPVEPSDRVHTYHQYVVRVRERDRVRAHLASRDIATEVYYPVPFHRQTCFAAYTHSPDAYPVADRAALEVLALPVFPGLSGDQQAHVVASVAEAVR
ncbi:MAG TPA: DegT/DnrJ/EryC1/StrS family aminotransferase [Vicinamibacterales bacterium]|nr:DegT/DnrJ/EryC1/StrS family aminotransferase [Vicinamibacterales bacterium]